MKEYNSDNDVYFDEIQKYEDVVELVRESKPIIDVLSLNVQIYIRVLLPLRKI